MIGIMNTRTNQVLHRIGSRFGMESKIYQRVAKIELIKHVNKAQLGEFQSYWENERAICYTFNDSYSDE